jgi:hypothetical protein
MIKIFAIIYYIIKNWILSIFFPNKQLFCYGSNSIEQLKDRLQIDELMFTPAYIDNYSRIFAGKSKKWQDGADASIYPHIGKKVFGILVEIPNKKLKVLDSYEGGYYQKEIIVNNGKNTVKAIVYIKINNEFKTLPSNEYLEAINRMLDNRGCDNERVIMVRAVIKDEIKHWENGIKHMDILIYPKISKDCYF